MIKLVEIIYKNSNYRNLWMGQTLSFIGSWVTNITLNILIWELTKSAKLVAIVIGLKILPTIVAGPYLGVLADKFDRRKLLILVDLIDAVCLGVIILCKSIWILMLFSLASGITYAISFPTFNSFMPELVKKETLVEANSLFYISRTMSRPIGSTLAGIVISTWGVDTSLIIDFATYLFSVICCMAIKGDYRPIKENSIGKKITATKHIKEGIEYILNSSMLKNVLLLSLILIFIEGSISGSQIVFVKEILKANNFQLSTISAVQGLGVITGALILQKIQLKYNKINFFILCGLLRILSSCFFVTCSSIYTLNILFFITNIFWMFSIIIQNSIIQYITPNEIRGNVYSIYSTVTRTIMLGVTIVFGYMADVFNVKTSITIVCLITLAIFGILSIKIWFRDNKVLSVLD